MTQLVQHDDNIFYLHFNVDSHRMPLDEYLAAIEGAKEVFDGINKEIFGGKLKYELDIYAPKNGSIKTLIKYVVIAGGIVFDSDLRKKFIAGVVGSNPEQLAEDMGKALTLTADKVINSEVAAKLHSKCVKGFMEKTPEVLEEVGLLPRQFKKAYEGKNKFYDACSKVDDLKGVGFTDQEGDFPVDQTFFCHQIVTFDDEEESSEWEISQKATLFVYATCWEVGDTKHKWRARWDKKDLSFEIKDGLFWKTVIEGNLKQVTTGDRIIAQLAVSKKSGRKTGVVLSVLSYNGQEISQPKSNEELAGLVNNFSIEEPIENRQIDLFLM